MQTRPRRSALYLPASNQRAIDKSRGAACDVVILDLEDAVGPEDKALARRQAVEAVGQGGFGARELVVRCNGLETPWGRDDLDALRAVQPDAVLVPKVSSPKDIGLYAEAVGAGGPGLWAMIETCTAILHLGAIAGAEPLRALVLGSNDLAREMRCRLDVDRGPIQTAMSLCVTAGRAHGLVVLDGVFNALEDAAGLERQCRQAVDFGFDGKTLIHPNQIAACNRAFSPGDADIAWARAVVEAFARPENAGAGALRLQGAMVERLHLDAAGRILALADAETRA
jgi:citrate lyase subunit beta/citryl-CoA lyase